MKKVLSMMLAFALVLSSGSVTMLAETMPDEMSGEIDAVRCTELLISTKSKTFDTYGAVNIVPYGDYRLLYYKSADACMTAYENLLESGVVQDLIPCTVETIYASESEVGVYANDIKTLIVTPVYGTSLLTDDEDTEYECTITYNQQTLDKLSYECVDTENYSYVAGSYIMHYPKIYEGFKTPEAIPLVVSSDEELNKIEYKYDRLDFTLTTSKGEGIASVTEGGIYPYGTELTINAVLEDGYTWAGWTGTESVGDQNYNFTMPAKNLELVANTSVTEYDINYDLNGGTVDSENPVKYTFFTDAFSLIAPEKKGYEFTGWSGTDLEELTKSVTIDSGSVGDRNYTANYDVLTYNISYKLNGGDATNVSEYTVETETFTIANPTKEGFTFEGWLVNDATEPVQNVTITKGSTGDLTLEAVFSANKYTVTANKTDGIAAIAGAGEYNFGEQVTLEATVNDGFVWTGWSGDLTGVETSITFNMPADDVSVMANASAITYVLTLDTQCDEHDNSTRELACKAVFGELPVLERGDYIFAGWYDAPIGGNRVTASAKMPAKDTTIYAHWCVGGIYNADGELVISIEDLASEYGFNVATDFSMDPNAENYYGSAASSMCNVAKELGLGEYSIVLPKDTTKIGNCAFAGCEGLIDVIIPEGVTSIEDNAFKDCTKLETVVLPDSLTSLGTGVFSGCTNLKDINIPENITVLPDEMFKNCVSLKDIVLPSEIQTIGNSVFEGCTSLKDVNLPDGLTSIGNGAFKDCISMIEIVVPESVMNLGEEVFSGCSSLNTVYVYGTIETIKESVFKDCVTLEKVVLSETITTIEKDAFNGCSSLKNINIPSELETIGDSAFKGCEMLPSVDLPDTLTSIGNSAFEGCSTFSNVTIPENVTSIGSNAFNDCKGIIEIVFKGTTLPTIGTGAFNKESGDTIIFNFPEQSMAEQLPVNTYNPEYGEFAVEGTSLYQTVIFDAISGNCSETERPYKIGGTYKDFPDATKSAYSFDGWYTAIENGKKLSITDVVGFNDITVYARYSPVTYTVTYNLDGGVANGLVTKYTVENTDFVVPTPTKSGYEFVGWTVDTSSTVNKTYIVDTAIAKNISLKAVWKVKTYTQIVNVRYENADGTFTDYERLASKNVAHGNRFSWKQNADGTYAAASVNEYVVTSAETHNVTVYRNKYTVTVNKGTGIASVSGAGNYRAGQSVTLDATLDVGYDWLQWASENNQTQNEQSYTFTVEADTVWTATAKKALPKVGITFSDSSSKAKYKILTVSENGGTVAYVKPNKKTYTSAKIPKTVTYQSIKFIVTEVSSKAFYKNTKLKSVSIGSNVTKIGTSAFQGCTKLTKVKVPAKVTSIGNKAFYGCKKVKTLNLGKGVKKIGTSAFQGCTALTKVTIPASTTSIGSKAFYGCKKVKKVTLGSKVKTIGASAFQGNKALTSITIPSKVTKIGSKAFYKCNKLGSVTIKGTKLKTIGKYAFKGTKKKIKVTVPKSKYSAYKKLLKSKGLSSPVYKKK